VRRAFGFFANDAAWPNSHDNLAVGFVKRNIVPFFNAMVFSKSGWQTNPSKVVYGSFE